MKFCLDTHSPKRMNPNDFTDPLSPLAPPAGQSFHLSSEISQYSLDGLAQNFAQTFMVDGQWILMIFADPF